jgi:hypothetical protein
LVAECSNDDWHRLVGELDRDDAPNGHRSAPLVDEPQLRFDGRGSVERPGQRAGRHPVRHAVPTEEAQRDAEASGGAPETGAVERWQREQCPGSPRRTNEIDEADGHAVERQSIPHVSLRVSSMSRPNA